MRLGVRLSACLFTQCAGVLQIRACWKQRQKHFLSGDLCLEPLFLLAGRVHLVAV